MKKIPLKILILLASINCFSQRNDSDLGNKVFHRDVVATKQTTRSQIFNDTMLFTFHPLSGFLINGSTNQNQALMHLESRAEGGRKHTFASTGGNASIGQGKFALRDSEIILPLMVFDSMGRMGIHTANPDPSAVLDVSSNQGGLLLPRLTSAQIDNIPEPAAGLILYDKIANRYVGWNDTMMLRLDNRWIPSADGSSVCLDTLWRVGIGTENPVAALHVKGPVIFESVKTNGDFRPLGVNENGKLGLINDSLFHSFWNDTMMFANVSPLDFRQTSGNPALFFGDNNITCSYGDPGVGTLVAPLSLTSSAISDSFMLRFVDENPGGNMTFEFLAVKNDGTGMQTLAGHTTAGSDSSVREYAMAIPGNHKIDLTTYCYYLRVSSGDWGGNLQIAACTLLSRL